MTTLGGSVCIRNGDELDFCWREAVKSLLPVCDEVVICDGESTDGTQAAIREWATTEPKINICVYPWPNPCGDAEFWVKWLNYARQHLKSEWHFQLDADEVLHEQCYPEVSRFIHGGPRSAVVTRHNFWTDHRHTIPDGFCCGKKVIRIAPTKMWLASDGYHPMGEPAASIAVNTNIEIFHYGFIRKRSAFFTKERQLQRFFFNTYDPRLEALEQQDCNWMANEGSEWGKHLDTFSGNHPAIAIEWLRNRGYH